MCILNYSMLTLKGLSFYYFGRVLLDSGGLKQSWIIDGMSGLGINRATFCQYLLIGIR